MHFFYDAQSRPAMVKFNGALYSRVHGPQRDVVGSLTALEATTRDRRPPRAFAP